MQAQIAKAQAELEHKTVNVSAAGGKVKVAANGAGENSRDQDWQTDLDPNDVEFLEDAVSSAIIDRRYSFSVRTSRLCFS